MNKSLTFFFIFVVMSLFSLLGCVNTSTNTQPLGVSKSPTPNIEGNASWLSGSWGVTQRVNGGYKLDEVTGKSNFIAGAKEIVENLPSAGHVITSFTHPAHAYLFTLRNNPNVDVANIHPKMVPTLKNEKIILEVIKVYRSAGKKVILYLNAAGPSMIKDSHKDKDIKVAWENYYQSEWGGDEGAAWRNLVQGYAERFKGLVDGYWLDNARKLPGEMSDFITMLRDVDPRLAITVNKSKTYFKNNADDYLLVDSDGLDDKDDRDYKIIKYAATNEFEDFTSGHITPLGRGAPPNSWGYEEYTIPDMVKAPWDNYKHNNNVLKHAWFPIRERWSVAKTKLVFEVEQAYRFTHLIIGSGASITWSTTQNKGYMSADEMKIMLEIERRLKQHPRAEYQRYKRPKGAYLKN